MGEDEAATVNTLTTYREIMTDLIKQHRGRVIDSPGDNLLAEFTSVVDAVQCAVSVQKELQARNAELPDNRRMQFRIGVNLGDVIEEEERIYGDGVNIAARLESLADPGGICVSKTAFDHIESKLPLGYEYLGEQEVKNIAKPVGAYRVLMEPRVTVAEEVEKERAVPVWRQKSILVGGVILVLVVIAAFIWNFYFRPPPVEVASVERMAFPLPDKPSIAVLPFVNMSEDPKQEYLTDGISENIISALSKVPMLFVIARNSTFTYKGKPVKVQKVAEELGVRYVLEGSVQRSGDTLRITAQLIDAITGYHLWSERYDRELKDVFALQDEITMKIITALQVKLTVGEQERVYAKGTDSVDAYIKYLQGSDQARRVTKEDNLRARRLANEAIALDPDYPSAYYLLAQIHWLDPYVGLSKDPKQSIAQAIMLAEKAISMDDSLAEAHGLLGVLYGVTRQYDKGIAQGERAVALNPNDPSVLAYLSITLRVVGRFEEAARLSEKAVRLNPFPEAFYFQHLGMEYFYMGRYEEAVEAHRKAVNITPNSLLYRVCLVMAYIGAGREQEARAEAEEVLKIYPKFSVKNWRKKLVYKNQADVERQIDALRKAGLPD
jgi:adenylate cyclase